MLVLRHRSMPLVRKIGLARSGWRLGFQMLRVNAPACSTRRVKHQGRYIMQAGSFMLPVAIFLCTWVLFISNYFVFICGPFSPS